MEASDLTIKRTTLKFADKYFMETTFNVDWTTPALLNLVKIRSVLKHTNAILEIGAYEGRTSCWMLKNMLSETGSITCIDPFLRLDCEPFSLSVEKNKLQDEDERKRRFLTNTSLSKKSLQTVRLLEGRSYQMLSKLIQEDATFDFIYIDGNHTVEAVISDAVMSFGLLKTGGIMLFDDYLLDPKVNWFYQNQPDDIDNSVKLAVDYFLHMFKKHVEFIPLKNSYQLAVLKK